MTFLNKFAHINLSLSKNQKQQEEKTIDNNFVSKVFPNTTKHSLMQNKNATLSQTIYNETINNSISPPKDRNKPNIIDSLKFKKSLEVTVKKLKVQDNPFTSKLDSLRESKQKDKTEVLRKNVFSQDNFNLPVKDEKLISMKDFVCCAIYNNSSIIEKLSRYAKVRNIVLRESSINKYECVKDGNTVGIEFTKIGHKGMNFMKMFHISGSEKQTKEIIKNLIINIGL